MRYSDILGEHFYKIGLNSEDADLIDLHYTASAHHLKRFREATTQKTRYYHLTLHRAHQRKFMLIVYQRGDFSNAIDESNQDLDRRPSWNPSVTAIPDRQMYRSMLPDWRYGVGEAHCSDIYLHDDEIEVVDKKVS